MLADCRQAAGRPVSCAQTLSHIPKPYLQVTIGRAYAVRVRSGRRVMHSASVIRCV